jgi:hypothetical protein
MEFSVVSYSNASREFLQVQILKVQHFLSFGIPGLQDLEAMVKTESIDNICLNSSARCFF